MNETRLLTADGLINLALGIPLMLFPTASARFLAIPVPSLPFYPSILGAVLTGIGIALLLQRGGGHRVIGLGIAGAVSINLCGAGALVAWLIRGGLEIPLRGHLFLWMVAVVVLGIGVIEIFSQVSRKRVKTDLS